MPATVLTFVSAGLLAGRDRKEFVELRPVPVACGLPKPRKTDENPEHMAHLLLVGKGGFGDLIPMFALATALQQRGHAVRIAAEAHHAAACATMGLTLAAVDLASSSAPPANPADVKEGGHAPHWGDRLRATLAPRQLESELEQLLPSVRWADLVIGNQLAYAGRLACQVERRRWVFSAASPLAIPSRHDAPYWPYLYPWQKRAAGLGWSQRPFLPLARLGTRVFMQSQVSLSRRLGVPHAGHPRFEGLYSPELNLLMTSPELAPAQPDWPKGTVATGFAWFDPPFLGGADQEQAIVAFAQAGPPPIVFAPGGSTRVDPGTFFEQSLAAADRLGRRAIIVAAKRFHGQFQAHDGVLVTGYFPYARLFRHAALVVHSAGIGALGWAARYGVPSLLIPSEWDQFDNARRAQRLGLGRTLDAPRYTAALIAAAIQSIESDRQIADGLARLAPILGAEDGAKAASGAVESLLSGSPRKTGASGRDRRWSPRR
ncbi:glycosyltransferase [Thiomonas sp.]